MKLNPFYVDDLIKNALLEDINYIDAATDLLIDETSESTALMISKADGVLAGIDVALRVFTLLDSQTEFTKYFEDGAKLKRGDKIAEIRGKTTVLLKAERTALNILQHMSGIATATNVCVELVSGSNVTITDTRKTLPGLRPLQKYAVAAGGGKNHRYNLSDAAMLKDNHIDAYKSIEGAVKALRAKAGHMLKIEVEVRNFDELEQALRAQADVIMLDNMSCNDMAKAVKTVNGRALLEASGNITVQNIAEVAATGVDVISLGALTHSATCFDISMKIV